jgi:hypothetical protein
MGFVPFVSVVLKDDRIRLFCDLSALVQVQQLTIKWNVVTLKQSEWTELAERARGQVGNISLKTHPMKWMLRERLGLCCLADGVSKTDSVSIVEMI